MRRSATREQMYALPLSKQAEWSKVFGRKLDAPGEPVGFIIVVYCTPHGVICNNLLDELTTLNQSG